MIHRSLDSAVLVGAMLWAAVAFAGEPDWESVDRVFGSLAKVQPDGVRRFGWPRSDLHVKRDGVSIEPTLALGSWAAFHGTPAGTVMAMGDLVLLEPEVNPVVDALQAGGIEAAAIHNHLIGETPHVMYLHFFARGNARDVATTLKAALQQTATPLSQPVSQQAVPTAQSAAVLQRVEETLGRKGSMAGRVLQVSVPRAQAAQENGMEIPNSMGVANALNFQAVGDRVAATGDFVLVASEVNPVVRELRTHRIEITALHSHMLTETPRLFFLHFWGLDKPEIVATALKAALERVATK